MNEVIIEEMCDELPILKDYLDTNRDIILTVHLARLFYLWRALKKPEFDLKSLHDLNSMEALIQINALFKGKMLCLSKS